MNKAITFDDVLLVPKYSRVSSRKNVDLTSLVTPNVRLDLPIIASCMDSVSGPEMVIAMSKLGAAAILHRYMKPQEQVDWVKSIRVVVDLDSPVIVAVGTKQGTLDHVQRLVEAGVSCICVDVAHGHHQSVFNTVGGIKRLGLQTLNGEDLTVIAGNVATEDGAIFLAEAGADSIRIGIGNGSICTTRLVTGHGVPQLTALLNCSEALISMGFENSVTLISDGGVRNSGDIVKALAFGATAIMSGSLFSGTDEAPGETIISSNGEMKTAKIYRGMASREAQEEFFGNYVDAPEGVNTIVPTKGPVASIVNQLAGGIRSGLSYSGATTIKELQLLSEFISITPAGFYESQAAAPYKRK